MFIEVTPTLRTVGDPNPRLEYTSEFRDGPWTVHATSHGPADQAHGRSILL
jgi:hypothetical protein